MRQTLHKALPEVEKMYGVRQKATEKLRYSVFVPALETNMAKLSECYQRTVASNAHIVAMCRSFKSVSPSMICRMLCHVLRCADDRKQNGLQIVVIRPPSSKSTYFTDPITYSPGFLEGMEMLRALSSDLSRCVDGQFRRRRRGCKHFRK